MTTGTWKAHTMVLALLGIGVIAAYFHTIDYPFVFDDRENITGAVQLDTLSAAGIKQVLTQAHAANRPVANLSFAVNWAMGGGDVVPFHITNLAIHIGSGWLVYVFALLTLQRACGQPDAGTKRWAVLVSAAAVALVWAMHPIQTQAVTYIVQRMTSMCAMFCLLALCLYAAGRQHARRPWFMAGSVVAWLLALGCKEIAISLPVLVWLYEWFFFRQLRRQWLISSLKYAVPVAIVALVAARIYLGEKPVETLTAGYHTRDFSMLERQFTQFRVLVFYLSLLAWPLPGRLNLDHHFLPSSSLVSPVTTLLSLGLLLALLAGGCLAARRYRLAAFGVLWYFVTLALESSIINLEMAFEHRLYLPSVGVLLAVVSLVMPRLGGQRRGSWLPAAGVAALVLVLVLGAMTWQRNRVWRDVEVLWQDCAGKSPDKARPQYNLGVYYARQEQPDEAISRYRNAVRLRPKYIEALLNLGLTLMEQGELQEAFEAFSDAIRHKPDHPDLYINRAVVLKKLGKPEAALADNQAAVALMPDNAKAQFNLGTAFQTLGRTKEEIAAYERVLEIDPEHATAHQNIGVAYARTNVRDKALEHLTMALRLQPDTASLRLNLGNYFLGKDLDKAQEHYAAAVALDAESEVALNGLATIAVKRGDDDTAIEHFEQAIAVDTAYGLAQANYGQLRHRRGQALLAAGKFAAAEPELRHAAELIPGSAEIHNNLGAVLGQQRKLREALEHFARALELDPEYTDARSNLDGVKAMLERQKKQP